jgi:homoserine kinase
VTTLRKLSKSRVKTLPPAFRPYGPPYNLSRQVTVTVPASSGNIGPGFDVLGLALKLRNELHVRVMSPRPGLPLIRVVGEAETSIPRDGSNTIFKTIQWVFKKAGKTLPRLELTCVNRIPLKRGLGSSSAAYLCGLLAANRLLRDRFSKNQILNWATDLEGHPDNVGPAYLGGLRASGKVNGNIVSIELPDPLMKLVLVVPEFELSTKRAREILPKHVLMKDAVWNLSSVAFLPFALRHRQDWLKYILNDRLHEPYRAKLIPGFYRVKKEALKAGSMGVVLSGAGPTILSFTGSAQVRRVAKAMISAFKEVRIPSRALEISIDKKGAVVK